MSAALKAVRRRWWAVLFVIGLCTGGALAAAYYETPVYQATSRLLVDTRLGSTSDFDSNLQNGELLSRYFLEKVKSRSVLEAVARDQGLPPSAADRIGAQISAQVLKGSHLLAVTATSVSPSEASGLANNVSNETVRQNQQEAQQRFASDRSYLDSELQRLDREIAAEQLALRKVQSIPINNASVEAEITSHQARLNGLQEQYSNTYSRRQTLAMQQDRLANALVVSEPAVPPDRPARPVPPLYLAAGLLGGIVLGLLTALLLGYLDRRVRGPDGLADATGAPVTVSVDHRRRRSAPVAAAYSLVWATLLSQRPNARTIMLVGASGHDSTAQPASSLAEVAAAGNRSVIVLGSNDGRPDDANRDSTATSNPMTQALQQRAREDYLAPSQRPDIVIAPVPAPSQHPAAMVMAHDVDAAIVIATEGATPVAEARHTAESLRVAGVPLVAGIIVRNGSRGSEHQSATRRRLLRSALEALRGRRRLPTKPGRPDPESAAARGG